jgi:hypothetical protein
VAGLIHLPAKILRTRRCGGPFAGKVTRPVAVTPRQPLNTDDPKRLSRYGATKACGAMLRRP